MVWTTQHVARRLLSAKPFLPASPLWSEAMTTRRSARCKAAPLPLFAWAAACAASQKPPRRELPRLMLLDLARDADGMPRPALMLPGRRLPTIFPSIAAALAAARSMGAGQ
jgi:hypothetical protein